MTRTYSGLTAALLQTPVDPEPTGARFRENLPVRGILPIVPPPNAYG